VERALRLAMPRSGDAQADLNLSSRPDCGELAASGLVVLGDKGYIGQDAIRAPYRGGTGPRPRASRRGLGTPSR
jgi:hypothetical protein